MHYNTFVAQMYFTMYQHTNVIFCIQCVMNFWSSFSLLGWPNVPKVELEISTPLQIKVLNEISALLKL